MIGGNWGVPAIDVPVTAVRPLLHKGDAHTAGVNGEDPSSARHTDISHGRLLVFVPRQVNATTAKQVKKNPVNQMVAGLLGVFASAMRQVAARVNAAKRIAIMSAPKHLQDSGRASWQERRGSRTTRALR